MGIEAIGEGLKKTLSVKGFKVYSFKEFPNKVSPPCAIMLPGEIEYHATFGSSPYNADFMVRLIVLLGKTDLPSAGTRMLDYIDMGGSKAIVQEVETDPTLNSSCQAAIVTRNLGFGVTNWGGVDYLSTEFEIQIWT